MHTKHLLLFATVALLGCNNGIDNKKPLIIRSAHTSSNGRTTYDCYQVDPEGGQRGYDLIDDQNKYKVGDTLCFIKK